jgi:membrane protein implicated in regulation of membrane protease activity
MADAARRSDARAHDRHSAPPDDGRNGHHRPDDPLQDLMRDLAELRSYAKHFVAAKLDGVKLGVRKVLLRGAFAVVGLVFTAALVITGAVLLLSGLSGAFGALVGIPWLGDLITAGLFFALLTIGVIVADRALVQRFRKALTRRYDARKAAQRLHHGTDVEHRAAENARSEIHG